MKFQATKERKKNKPNKKIKKKKLSCYDLENLDKFWKGYKCMKICVRLTSQTIYLRNYLVWPSRTLEKTKITIINVVIIDEV